MEKIFVYKSNSGRIVFYEEKLKEDRVELNDYTLIGTTEIEVNKIKTEEKEEVKFPCIMEANLENGITRILALSVDLTITGYVISSKEEEYTVGYYSTRWSRYCFKPVKE